jgi:hypothetical protein
MTTRACRGRLDVGEGGRVDAARSVAGIAMVFIGAAFVAPACAQEPTQPNLLLQLSPPAKPVAIDSMMRDDIKDRPAPPRADPLQEPFRVYVGVGDPRCFPGEDRLGVEPMGRGARRRSH